MPDTPRSNATDRLDASIRAADAIRIPADGSPPKKEAARVIVEEHVTVLVEDLGSYVLMCTPCDLRALAAGFLRSEGIIRSIDDVSMLMGCDDDPSVVRVRLANPPDELPEPGRNMIVASSCGMCGSRSIEEILEGLEPVGNSLAVSAPALTSATEEMRARQYLFEQTGAAHAAGVFLPSGEIIAFAEDIGRHNALDKAIGKCLLMEKATQGCGAVLSGRVSFELVTKAANAGIELIVAVSAPSSLALDVARRCNITLCGFVRDDRATVYTNPRRIHGLNNGGDP